MPPAMARRSEMVRPCSPIIAGIGKPDEDDPHAHPGDAGEDRVGPEDGEDKEQGGHDRGEHIEDQMPDLGVAGVDFLRRLGVTGVVDMSGHSFLWGYWE